MAAPMSIDAELYPVRGARVRRAVQSARAELLDAKHAPFDQADRQSRPSAQSKATAQRYRAQLVSDRDSILALETDWQALTIRSSGSVAFQAFDLCLPWLDAYAFGSDPTHHAHILAIYDADELVGLVPLAVRRDGPVALAEWVGDPLIQYGDVLLDADCDAKAVRACLAEALKQWPLAGLLLRNVRADARVHQLLDLPGHTLGETRQAAIADLTGFGSAEDYFATFSKRSRQNRRKKRNALAKRGELSFEVVEAGPQAAELCDLALDWKLAWLAARGLSSRAFMDARALKTLKASIARSSVANPMTLFVQKVDGKPAAIEIGLTGSHGNIAFMGTYDPAYEALSAGKVQMESSILHGFEAGWAGYDMLAPMTGYKESWSTMTVDVVDYLVASSPAAWIYREGFLKIMRPTMKCIWLALPASLRSTLLRSGGGLAVL